MTTFKLLRAGILLSWVLASVGIVLAITLESRLPGSVLRSILT